MELINMTPHTVVLLQSDGRQVEFLSAGSVRLTEETEKIDRIEGARFAANIYQVEFELGYLPPEREGILYIVSGLAAETAQREDFIVPYDIVRDSRGQIVGCKSFRRAI